jgi:hypothetical protein
MQTIAFIALIIGLVMLFRWLGPPVHYLSHEKKPKKRNPDEDLPPPTLM